MEPTLMVSSAKPTMITKSQTLNQIIIPNSTHPCLRLLGGQIRPDGRRNGRTVQQRGNARVSVILHQRNFGVVLIARGQNQFALNLYSPRGRVQEKNDKNAIKCEFIYFRLIRGLKREERKAHRKFAGMRSQGWTENLLLLLLLLVMLLMELKLLVMVGSYCGGRAGDGMVILDNTIRRPERLRRHSIRRIHAVDGFWPGHHAGRGGRGAGWRPKAGFIFHGNGTCGQRGSCCWNEGESGKGNAVKVCGLHGHRSSLLYWAVGGGFRGK